MLNFDVDNEKEYRMRNIAYGFKYAKNEYLESEEYKRELVRIEGLKLPKIGTIRLPKTDLKKMQTEVTKFFMNTFKGLDWSVTTISEKKYTELAHKITFLGKMSGSGVQELLDSVSNLIKTDTKKGSIFSVPITLIKNHISMDGGITKFLPLLGDVEFLKNLPISINSIYMGDSLDRLSHGTYAHEITHGLLDRHKGVIENYNHNEMLSIFMEKVVVDNFDKTPNKKVIKTSEVYRLKHIQENIAKLSNQDPKISGPAMQYILGGLLAGVMFDKYQNENEQGRRRMLANVKTVLAGNKTVEQLLEEEQISLDSGNLTRYVDKVEGYAIELENERVK